MEALILLVSLAWLALTIWFVVIAVRFLRSGRKAFDRYVALTDDHVPPTRRERERAAAAMRGGR